MRRFSLQVDLGLQLLALYILFVGLVVAAALFFSRLAGDRVQADVKAADLALARAVAQESNAAMTSAQEAVRQLSGFTAVIQADDAGMRDIFSTLMSVRSDVNLVYRLSSDGIMLYHYPEGLDSTLGVDFSFRDYFQRALTSDGPLVSKGRTSPTTNQAVATAVMPLWSAEDEFLGLVATNIKLQSLSHTLSGIVREYPPEEGFEILIIDSAGQVIAHSDPKHLLENATESIPEVTQAVLSRQEESLIRTDTAGVERLYTFTPVYSVGWGVIVSRPTAVAFATPIALQRGVLIAIAIFLAGGFFYWLALSRRIIIPLEKLAAYSQAIGEEAPVVAEDQFDISRIRARPDQIGHLTRSLTWMRQTIDDRLNELSTLLQTSAAVVSSLDSRTVLDRILEQVERLMGLEMSAVFALDEQQDIFRAYASRGLSQWYTEHAIIAPYEPGSVTMRAINSGQPIQISDTETNPSFRKHRGRARVAGYRSVLAVPLKARHTSPAALLVFRPEPHEFTRREINLLTNFANHAAMAIENAALFARSDMQLQEQTRRLESLIQSMTDGLILENLTGQVVYANRSVLELAGVSLPENGRLPVESLMDAMLARALDREGAAQAVKTAVSDTGTRHAEFALEFSDRPRYFRMRVFDVTDPEGTLIGRGRILRDITQRHEIDRMKSSLISTVSHELRTPLAAIKGYATTLLADDVEWDAASQREFLDIISLETDRLSDLVTDLLDMSRIEAGSLEVKWMACDLGELVMQAALRTHLQADGRLHIEIPPDLPPLYADPQRIESVLRNLIENAAKYSGEDSPIYVRAQADQTQIIVSVADEGPGIPEEHGQRIFTSFYRVENGLTRGSDGAGLGLAICHGFIRAHGGKIWLEPQEKGTCVSFSLPLVSEEVISGEGTSV